MTGEEIKAAIERLRKVTHGARVYTATEVLNAIYADDWVGCLIDLLEQADPDSHVELPRDADGEYVHVGDRMVLADGGEPFVVEAIGGNLLWFFDDELLEHHNWESYECRHYKPTVEDVLHEFAKKWIEGGNSEDDVFAEYAEKLRKTVKEEQ